MLRTGGEVGDCGRTVTVAAEASDGWGFRRWTEAGEVVSTESVFDLVLDRDRSLVAEFQERCAVAVSAEPEEGGLAEVVEGRPEGPCGRVVVLTATPVDGWGFLGWFEDGAEVARGSPLELTLDRDRDLVAGFERLCALELTVAPAAGGSATMSEGSSFGACGRVVTVTAEAASGWIFVEWVEDGAGIGGEPVLSLSLDEDRILEARFVEAGDLAGRVLAHVLEGGEMPSPAERGALDRLGNGNGFLDVGDLLALLDAHPDAMGGRR